MARAGRGGGLGMSKVVTKREGTRETPKVRAVSPCAVDQLGQQLGTRRAVEPLYQGKSFQPTPLGNELATNVGGGGPGAGRTIHECGSQGQHGPVNPGGMRGVPDVGMPVTSKGWDEKGRR